jgi:hypothetical protein
MNWIPITEKLPKEHEFVLFCCYIEDEEGFGDVDLGWYEGRKTMGDAIVMETRPGDDSWWMPCTHWMHLPPTPEVP